MSWQLPVVSPKFPEKEFLEKASLHAKLVFNVNAYLRSNSCAKVWGHD